MSINSKYGVIIVGAGAAGVQCAIRLASWDVSVALVSRQLPDCPISRIPSFSVNPTTSEIIARENIRKLNDSSVVSYIDNAQSIDITQDKFWMVKTDNGMLFGDNVVLALGAPTCGKLPIDLSKFEDIELDAEGRLITDTYYRATYPNLFAVGEAASGFIRNLSCALGTGDGAGRSLASFMMKSKI